MSTAGPNYAHLLSLSGPYGIFEHAEYADVREEHGYCTDDVARALLVCERESFPSTQVEDVIETSLRFLEVAQADDGTFWNRRHADGTFFGASTTEDCWGRAMWALGTTVATSVDDERRVRARRLFHRGARQRSPWRRSMAFAALGAGEILSVDGNDTLARDLLRDARDIIYRPAPDPSWVWSEDRLSYANALLPESLLVIGEFLSDRELVDTGLRQLSWLLDLETPRGFLSVTPVGGRTKGRQPPLYDQQPIEVATMSEACVRAFELTGDETWRAAQTKCVEWFSGANDLGAVMFDADTGGGYDGLTEIGPNLNQGAESTMALLTTLQHARLFERTSP